MRTIKYAIAVILSAQLVSCNQSAENELNSDEVLENSDVFNQNNPHADPNEMVEIREVTVLEVLPTTNYQYLRVSEEGEESWIAVSKTEIEVGKNYILIGGMEQTNFKSKELDRVFETLTLVTQILPARNGEAQSGSDNTVQNSEPIADVEPIKNRASGTTLISELLKTPKNYQGKKVRVQGVCTKVNNNIMGKNWVHVNDGTNGGFDFLATTSETIAVGNEVILEGTVALDKDFGAGYKYSLMIENCQQIK